MDVVKVKAEEIVNLTGYGFQDEQNIMLFETETGIIAVDKETG